MSSPLRYHLSLTLPQDTKLGRNVARTFLDYYKYTGYISTKPSSGLNPKPDHHANHHHHNHHNHHRDGRAASEPMRNAEDRYDRSFPDSRLLYEQRTGQSNGFDNPAIRMQRDFRRH
ncbi:hypothetical protein LSH36_384g01074 [Paralvinella palmiformis]|uniref:Uncharacterized protein n=1 Tax=Paralvinella palmiformis TaxID=53620 RepID=A0AAD9MYV7_9ANNE|nr:hypothetical protein LSH36_384g01074 [Paralvinella palmiformis]